MPPKFTLYKPPHRNKYPKIYNLPFAEGTASGYSPGEEVKLIAGLFIELTKLQRKVNTLENQIQVLAMNTPITTLPPEGEGVRL